MLVTGGDKNNVFFTGATVTIFANAVVVATIVLAIDVTSSMVVSNSIAIRGNSPLIDSDNDDTVAVVNDPTVDGAVVVAALLVFVLLLL